MKSILCVQCESLCTLQNNIAWRQCIRSMSNMTRWQFRRTENFFLYLKIVNMRKLPSNSWEQYKCKKYKNTNVLVQSHQLCPYLHDILKDGDPRHYCCHLLFIHRLISNAIDTAGKFWDKRYFIQESDGIKNIKVRKKILKVTSLSHKKIFSLTDVHWQYQLC